MKIICLFGNGDMDYNFASHIIDPSWELIAADGGARHCSVLHRVPNCIIGDLDSLEKHDWWKAQTQVIHDPDQNTTDLEKCLNKTQADLYIGFGFSGNRFDHTLEILHILQKYKTKNIIFFVGHDIIFRLPKIFSLNLPLSTRISLYPLKETHSIHASGLKYSLDGITFKQGTLIGTSNESTKPVVFIHQQQEDLACIVSREFFKEILQNIKA